MLLVADWRALADRWPWPLPSLPARVLGGWLCTYAASLLWFAVRERNWSKVEIVALPALALVVLDGFALRYRDSFHGAGGDGRLSRGPAVLGPAVVATTLAARRRAGARG